MTNQEAKSCIGTIEMLQRLAYNIHGVMDVIDADNCKKIIKALEQESCDDCISKQAVIDACEQSVNILEAVDRIMDLPPIEQEPKTGHWEQYGNSWEDKFKCSECGKEQPKILCGERIIGHWSDYCPNCGARMIDEQESEG